MTTLLEFIQARLDAEDDRLEDLRVVAPDVVLWVADNSRDNVHECLGIEQHGVKRYRRWWPGHGVTDWGHVMHSSAVELFSQQAVDRALRDIEAKRNVLVRHVTYATRVERNGDLDLLDLPESLACDGCGWDDGRPRTPDLSDCPELRTLASVFADHPDYDPSWSPT